MFTHIMVGTNDIARSKKFYDAVFAALNIPPAEISATGRISYGKHEVRFIVTPPLDGKPATPANGGNNQLSGRNARHGRRMAQGRCGKRWQSH